jgi:hypothetical protein
MAAEHHLTFGPFHLDLAQGRLWRGPDIPHRPSPRLMTHPRPVRFPKRSIHRVSPACGPTLPLLLLHGLASYLG